MPDEIYKKRFETISTPNGDVPPTTKYYKDDSCTEEIVDHVEDVNVNTYVTCQEGGRRRSKKSKKSKKAKKTKKSKKAKKTKKSRKH